MKLSESFLESDYNKDILKRLKGTLIWDDHFKFKKLCLKLFKLEINWKSKGMKLNNNMLKINPTGKIQKHYKNTKGTKSIDV